MAGMMDNSEDLQWKEGFLLLRPSVSRMTNSSEDLQ